GASAAGAGSASRSQESSRTVRARSVCTRRSVAGSRTLRAKSMTAGPTIGRREIALRIGFPATPDIVLGQPEIVGLVDVERIGVAHAIAHGRLAIERAATQRSAAHGEDRRAVAGKDAGLVLPSQDRRAGEERRQPSVLMSGHDRSGAILVWYLDDAHHRFGAAGIEQFDRLVDVPRLAERRGRLKQD